MGTKGLNEDGEKGKRIAVKILRIHMVAVLGLEWVP